ncbi:BnaA06g37390D [Brassica napus]|uniref:BnaA06g37390D protein n=2 Tax=Brassica TaxID=3705 RepID=A0A078GBG4_BRANA|nr:BnaA06g37390D [Brassica napus]
MTGTNVGEALLVLGWMKMSLIFPPRRLINCKRFVGILSLLYTSVSKKNGECWRSLRRRL